jgi:hypothetical protein
MIIEIKGILSVSARPVSAGDGGLHGLYSQSGQAANDPEIHPEDR